MCCPLNPSSAFTHDPPSLPALFHPLGTPSFPPTNPNSFPLSKLGPRRAIRDGLRAPPFKRRAPSGQDEEEEGLRRGVRSKSWPLALSVSPSLFFLPPVAVVGGRGSTLPTTDPYSCSPCAQFFSPSLPPLPPNTLLLLYPLITPLHPSAPPLLLLPQ